MAANGIDFVVTGDPVAVRATVEQALTSRGFSLMWQDDSTGIAERGSRVANVLIGALAQYFEVGVRIVAGQPGKTLVRIEPLSSGWSGGIGGVARTRRNIESLGAELEAIFRQAPGLRGVGDA